MKVGPVKLNGRTELLAALAVGGPLLIVGIASTSPAAATASAPPCVSILTPTIGAFKAGNTVVLGEVAAAPGLVSGAVLGPLAQIPGAEEAGSILFKAFPAIDALANALAAQGGAGLSTFNQSIAPLSAANPALNALVALGSNGLGGSSTALGNSIAPFDGTLAQLSQTIAFFSSATCSQ
ncbi:MAG TPA: hypothetical protein VG298_00445 [Acidimicrobiales bacterium]|jgi:hypothetical protein|nr:hypothetical protein [Acidimicrobiales bacterium]